MRTQKGVKIHGIGTGNNPNSRNGFKHGHVPSKETREKISIAGYVRFADETKHYNWQGDNVSYRSLHKWLQKWRGKPNSCEGCGKSGLQGQQIGWANVDHQYRRVLEDYIRLCAKCHGQYDKENKLRKRGN